MKQSTANTVNGPAVPVVKIEFAEPKLSLKETNKIVSKEFEPINSDDIFNVNFQFNVSMDTLGFDSRPESLFN